ncbi:GDSL-type esterase/lipase family protein [Lentilactobacillus kisonensis]|uniref:GDSL-type esterase/lipase family protein n=1 Tax=Lentilactobacillus kisonensis TaxID=481722 RepID=UPI001FB3B8B1|nr:GDSL-type esterase/lipase family protein [Lentilactobacillus kisonensis]
MLKGFYKEFSREEKESQVKLFTWYHCCFDCDWRRICWLSSISKRPPKAVKLVAVGDSLTQGVGDPKGRGGYTYLIREKVNQKNSHVKMATANFGISGETTDQIDHRVLTSTKLQRNLRHADVITMTTGGNDLLHFLKQNVMDSNGRNLDDKLGQYHQDYQKRVNRLFGNIRQLNHQAPIFVFGIYNPVYVYFPQVSFISQAVAENNSVTQAVVRRQSHMYFIPINKRMSDGQFTTTRSRQQLRKRSTVIGNKNYNAGEIEALLNGQTTQTNKYLSTADHFHPNEIGYQIMTNLLYKQLVKHTNWAKG